MFKAINYNLFGQITSFEADSHSAAEEIPSPL
jgi:hypothetical protein